MQLIGTLRNTSVNRNEVLHYFRAHNDWDHNLIYWLQREVRRAGVHATSH